MIFLLLVKIVVKLAGIDGGAVSLDTHTRASALLTGDRDLAVTFTSLSLSFRFIFRGSRRFISAEESGLQ